MYQVRDDTQVSDVDAAIVQSVWQRLTVHRGSGVVSTFSEESRNLDVQQEVGRVLDQVALLLEEVALGIQVLHAGGKDIGVKPENTNSLK